MKRRRRWLTLFCVGAVLSGCAPVDRPASPSSVALPDRFAFEAPGAVGPADMTLIALLPTDDPGFAALSVRALAEAPDLAIASARIDAARAGLRGARAALRPDISASAGASRERISAAQFGALPPSIQIQQYQNNFSTAVDASWDLDLFGRLRASQRASAARLDATSADADAVRLALMTDIAAAVTDFREVERRSTLVANDVDSARLLAELTAARAEAGLVPTSDTVRAQSLAVQAQARMDAISGERAEVTGRLVTLTGLSADIVLAAMLQSGVQPDPTIEPSRPPAISTTALRRRPDVLAAERRLIAADAEIAAAAAERFPSFSLTAGLGLVALALGDLLTQDAIIGSLGGTISGPLLDFGRVGARIDQRQADGREAFATYRKTLFTALGEAEAALGALDAAEKRAVSLRRQAALDEDAARLARERYRRGLASFISVLDAQRASLASRESAAIADADVRRRRIALYRAAGGTG